MIRYDFKSDYKPAGDQPAAIQKLVDGVNSGARDQVLLGVTGSGKTFTMANVIAQTGRPALIMAHNKTLAAQLYDEFKAFFPNDAVEYFVSYYDYYQPEAYVPRSDTFIEKTANINEQIDRMRHSATRSLFEKKNVIIIASVSCIYGIGDPTSYSEMTIPLEKGMIADRDLLLKRLVELQYNRNDHAFERGAFRVRGDTVDIHPSHLEDAAWRISFFDDEIEELYEFDPLTGKKIRNLETANIYPNSHYVVPKPKLHSALQGIKEELKHQLARFDNEGKLLESQRLNERTTYDIEMIASMGYCNGIENYSRILEGRPAGSAPSTLFDYLADDALVFVDESHVSVPQVGGMYKGDRARKTTLVEFGFRLPCAIDNRPMKFEEWNAKRPQTIYVSATPANHEMDLSGDNIAEQVVRPTGLVDPEIEIRPVEGQVDDLMARIQETTKTGFRTLVTTLTKKMAEQLTDYLHDNGIKVRYLHSDIDALERAEIIRDLRLGVFDVLVGINLLREGLDIPETALVAILDADKEGFLRSTTSLIQTVGRSARNVEGRAIFYADKITDSMKAAMEECDRRRERQVAYNEEHNITPKSTVRKVADSLKLANEDETKGKTKNATGVPKAIDLEKEMNTLRKEMITAAENLDFEMAAILRDRIHELEKAHLKA